MPKRTSPKVKFTDRYLKSLKPREKPYHVYDALVPGYLMKVKPGGAKIGALYVRFPPDKNATMQTIGRWPILPLGEQRGKALSWLAAISRWEDPRRKDSTAPTVKDFVDQFFSPRLSRNRKNGNFQSELARLTKRWGRRRLDEIKAADVIALCNDHIDTPASAHMLFSHARSLFNLAVTQALITTSPCTGLRPSQLIGPKQARDRVLNDFEVAAVWNAAEQLGPVWSSFYKLLITSIQRKSEIGNLQWSEVDFDQGLIVIPKERYKSASQHFIPVSSLAMDILRAVPRGASGPHVFSLDGGARPIRAFAAAKTKLDKLLPELPPWVVHDLRRTGRTNLAKLKIPSEIAELVLGHAQRGLVGVYDRHAYVEERREALEVWAAKLRSIVG